MAVFRSRFPCMPDTSTTGLPKYSGTCRTRGVHKAPPTFPSVENTRCIHSFRPSSPPFDEKIKKVLVDQTTGQGILSNPSPPPPPQKKSLSAHAVFPLACAASAIARAPVPLARTASAIARAPLTLARAPVPFSAPLSAPFSAPLSAPFSFARTTASLARPSRSPLHLEGTATNDAVSLAASHGVRDPLSPHSFTKRHKKRHTQRWSALQPDMLRVLTR